MMSLTNIKFFYDVKHLSVTNMQKPKKSGRLQTLFPATVLICLYISGRGGGKYQKDPSDEPAT